VTVRRRDHDPEERSMQRNGVLILVLTAAAAGLGGWTLAQSVEKSTNWVSPSGTRLRMLVDEGTLGGKEVELGEITFAANGDSGDHVHGSTEIFYVLEGELEHVVNGKSHRLTPGMVGYVRPPDRVRHKVGAAGAKALVIWAPGGESGRITGGSWKREP
jgi:quercetin dioxygenase-like cupin family protein